MIWRNINHGFQVLAKGPSWEPDGATRMQPRWVPSSRGIFTTKSTYHLLLEEGPATASFDWKQLWKFAGPSRGSFILWLVAHDGLKTGGLLWTRQCLESPRCEICKFPVESTLHAIRNCILPLKIWELLVPLEYWPDFWSSTVPADWVQTNLACMSAARSVGRYWKYVFRQATHDVWH